MAELTLYSMPSSGNSYKVRLLLALLNRPYQHVSCDNGSDALDTIKQSGNAPMGKVPVLRLEDGTYLAESNAILWYLAEATPFSSRNPATRAQILAWMFFEQNRHEPVIAIRAGMLCYDHMRAEATPEVLKDLYDRGMALLQIMENALAERAWFVGGRPTLADIALYAYTHTAQSRGGYDLSQFPALADWIARIAALPGYVGLEDIPA